MLAGKGLEICWVKDPVDAFFAQIQGSTRVKLDDGKLLRLNYDAHNGLPYTPVGTVPDRPRHHLQGRDVDGPHPRLDGGQSGGGQASCGARTAPSCSSARRDLAAHEECIGAQGVPLTPLRSLAVDRKRFMSTARRSGSTPSCRSRAKSRRRRFRRLMVAQDTGSAIIGPARADIYFGSGEESAASPAASSSSASSSCWCRAVWRSAVEGRRRAKGVPLPQAAAEGRHCRRHGDRLAAA